MFRIFAACLLACAATALVLPANAQDSNQDSPVLPAISQERLDLARQVFIASKSGRNFDQILPTVADRAKQTFIQRNPQIQLGVIEAVDRVALEMVANRKDLDKDLIYVWARAFEMDELAALLQFFQSPAGQKFSDNYPKVISTQLAVADNWTREIGIELARRVRDELARMARKDVQNLRGSTSEGGGQQ